MSQRSDLLESIAGITEDYRADDLEKPTPEHVEAWISQFDKPVQLPLLREIDHVLKRTYFPKKKVKKFLRSLITDKQFAGEDPSGFWTRVNFLNIQGGGNSQREILQLFDSILQKECEISVDDCGQESRIFVYLDDAIFSGNRVRRDLEGWIDAAAPKSSSVHVVTMATHRGGQYYANGRISTALKNANKKCDITWWHTVKLEDRRFRTNESDVLRPTAIPDLPEVQAYVQQMTYEPLLRAPGSVGPLAIYSSDQGRQLLEQEFLKAGVRIRGMCPYLTEVQRPLGHMTLETLGFGSLVVTYRNCPNNCPLALWAGDPWYPLFARKTN